MAARRSPIAITPIELRGPVLADGRSRSAISAPAQPPHDHRSDGSERVSALRQRGQSIG